MQDDWLSLWPIPCWAMDFDGYSRPFMSMNTRQAHESSKW